MLPKPEPEHKCLRGPVMGNGIGQCPNPRDMDIGHPGDRRRGIIPTLGLLDNASNFVGGTLQGQ
jgi:hypothetical protein